jgi:hypothetical protein
MMKQPGFVVIRCGCESEGIGPQAASDALRIAVASVHGVGYVVEWNFEHIANPLIRARLRFSLARAGIEVPVICGPDEAGFQPKKKRSMSTPENKTTDKPSFSGLYMSTFLAIGVAMGAAFSAIPVCICVGLAIGAGLDWLEYRAAKKRGADGSKE